MPGIKVDIGRQADLPGLPRREGDRGPRRPARADSIEYYEMGARFAKWRAVITIGDGIPTPYCIGVNADGLARYAALSQEAGLVPIVEPEVLMDGDHTIERCFEVTEETLHRVFGALHDQHVVLEKMLLKPNMVLSGKGCSTQASVEEVARATVQCFQRVVPAAVPGIVFLSGGQSNELATAHLSAMNALDTARPWQLSFSYGRALQDPPLKTWRGNSAAVQQAQRAFLHRAKLNGAARHGSYTDAMEKELAGAGA